MDRNNKCDLRLTFELHFSQIIVVSLIVGFAIYTLVKMGAHIWIGVCISIGYAIYPAAMFYSATAWKDFPFAAFILLFTVLILKIVQSNGMWLKIGGTLSLLF